MLKILSLARPLRSKVKVFLKMGNYLSSARKTPHFTAVNEY